MTTSEFSVFTKAMRTFFPKDNLLPTKESMDLWYRMLKDIPYPVAEAALMKHVSTSKWPPSIAEIRENATEAITPAQADWSEAWEEARKAVQKFGSYQETEALAWMSASTAEAVRRFGYYDLCMMENPEVAKAHFRDIYNNIALREKKEAQLPDSLKSVINNLRIGENGKFLLEA